ncbi:MAG TPA: hypothetical protein VKR06_22630 [Ktedonosporobacter sp.]|nr:hypothetical protein [Ktedonosporobacter sp.]
MEQAIASAVLAGLFSLIGIVLDNRLKRIWTSTVTQTLSSGNATSGIGQLPLTLSPFSIGKSLIHVGVIQLLANVVGFILGLVIGATGQVDTMTPETFMMIILVVGSCLLIIGFAISGAKVSKAYRWQHLFYVALGVLMSTLLVNYLLLNAVMHLEVPFDFSSLAVGVLQTFGCMGIGGAIANAVDP